MSEPTEVTLRTPFKPEVIGKLPKITCRECSKAAGKVCEKHTKKDCKACHNWLTTAHIDLDYVGHGPVTDRLLTVDPTWTWEPMAVTAEGAPFIGRGAGGESVLWIRLTVCGVTRIGVGSVAAGSFDTEKQLIGDALRNAAMRFGVALDLWAKDGLESGATDEPPVPPAQAPDDPAAESSAVPASGSCAACGGSRQKTLASGRVIPCPQCSGKEAGETHSEGDGSIEGGGASGTSGALRRQRAANATLNEAGYRTDDERHAAIHAATGGASSSSANLTPEQLVALRAYCAEHPAVSA